MMQLEQLKMVVEEEGDLRVALIDMVPTYRIPEYNQQSGLVG